jgi:ADP-ribosylglycohydrolase
MIMTKNRIDKLESMFYGAVLGDALGAPYEFVNNISPKFVVGESMFEYTTRYVRSSGWIISQPGQFTDDTEMTICLINAICKNGGIYDSTLAINEYIIWANEQDYTSMGKNTCALFKNAKSIDDYYSRCDAKNCDNQSNGALMRCFPLVTQNDEAIIADCSLTNWHPVCIATNLLFVHALKMCLNFNSPVNIDKHVIFDNIYKEALQINILEINHVFEQIKENATRDAATYSRC